MWKLTGFQSINSLVSAFIFFKRHNWHMHVFKDMGFLLCSGSLQKPEYYPSVGFMVGTVSFGEAVSEEWVFIFTLG